MNIPALSEGDARPGTSKCTATRTKIDAPATISRERIRTNERDISPDVDERPLFTGKDGLLVDCLAIELSDDLIDSIAGRKPNKELVVLQCQLSCLTPTGPHESD